MKQSVSHFIESTGGLITVLYSGVILFTGIAVGVQVWLPGHDVLLTFLIGLANQFAGGLFLLIKMKQTPTVDASGKSVEVNMAGSGKAEGKGSDSSVISV
jgi:hypothetical protein